MTNGEATLQAKDITKSFGRHVVLKGASLTMSRGEIIGIIGENGVGKSTLVRILMGLLAPDAGSIVSHGSFGYCPQELVIFDTLTVYENFQYFAVAYGLNNGWQDNKNYLLDHFGFSRSENCLASQLSGGTKQKLNLLIALLHSPDILILDEPYSGLDWDTYLRFWEYADKLRTEGKSVLIVSHLVNDRSRFDHIYDLRDGLLICG